MASDNQHADDMAAAQTKAISNIPRDMAVMKMQNDNIMALASAQPRDHASIKADLLEQLRVYPSFAKAAIYSKPVGTGDDGKMKFARGLSVRAAEALAEAYKYNYIEADVVVIDEDTVKVTATFLDYQNGRMWKDSSLVSKWYKKKNGNIAKHNDDRFYQIVVQAEKSKRIREVVVRCIPPGLRAELFDQIDRVMGALLTPEEMSKIVRAWSGKGFSLEELEGLLGKAQKDWTADDRLVLLQTWQSIADEEMTVAELKASIKEAMTGEVATDSAPSTTGPAAKTSENTNSGAAAKKSGGAVTAENLTNPQPSAEETSAPKRGRGRPPKDKSPEGGDRAGEASPAETPKQPETKVDRAADQPVTAAGQETASKTAETKAEDAGPPDMASEANVIVQKALAELGQLDNVRAVSEWEGRWIDGDEYAGILADSHKDQLLNAGDQRKADLRAKK